MARKKVTKSLRDRVWNKTKGRCWYCGKETIASEQLGFELGKPADMFTVDHFNPDGDDEINNLVPCCFSCNTRKNKNTLERFRYLMSNIGVVKFSEKQLEYLKKIKVTFPFPSYRFYFEREGL